MDKPKQKIEDFDVCRAAAEQVKNATPPHIDDKALKEAKKQRESAVKAGKIVRK